MTGIPLSPDDADFLDTIAKGFESVKVKPKGGLPHEVAAARAGNREFWDRAARLRTIARRMRGQFATEHRDN